MSKAMYSAHKRDVEALADGISSHLGALGMALIRLARAGVPVLGYDMREHSGVAVFSIDVMACPALYVLFGLGNCCSIRREVRGDGDAHLWMAVMYNDVNVVVKAQWWEGSE
jgi:hypothetical protein